MAESTDESRLKCKKCREILVRSPPHTFRDTRSAGEEGSVYSVNEENTPDWINTAIDQGGWTKGKLHCYSCNTRVGGFDFVGGVTDPIYIVKSRVDFWSPVPLVALVDKSGTDPANQEAPTPEASNQEAPTLEASNQETASGLVQANQDTASGTNSANQDTVSGTGPALANQETASGTFPGSGGTSQIPSDMSEDDQSDSWRDDDQSSTSHSQHESSSEGEQYTPPRSRRQQEKARRQRRRRERERKRRREGRSEHERVEAKLRELLEGEPELEQLPHDKICPVCLDLLHEPFQTEPCHHIFCEPCLRRLGQKNPMNTKCPMCRTRIRFCKHLAATSREIREEHEALYLRRKKFERGTPVYSYPLPWTPGWRNLIRGRPLGGNRLLVEDNHAEYLRTILHQIPYYIPPVMFANIINVLIFAFMIGFVEVLPSLLYAVFGSRGGDSSGDENLTETVAEISGEELLLDEGSAGADQDEFPVGMDKLDPEVLDTTFYFVLVVLGLGAALVGQFVVQQEPGARFGYRCSDILLVVCVTCLPLLVVPTFLPYRAPEGHYLGFVLKKITNYIMGHFSIHTVVMVLVLAWFVYYCDTNEDILG